MVEKYGIRKSEVQFPSIDLIYVEHRGGVLTGSYPAFGPDYFKNNTQKMRKQYSHSGELVSFREPTTSESISFADYNFRELAKKEILDPRWLQLGRVARAGEGVYVNAPRDKNGSLIEDEKVLKGYLNKAQKVNGIWVVPNSKIEGANDFVFVPYETFEQGVQSSGDFARGGLARGLEFSTGKKAEKLEKISSEENYPNGVNVYGWNSVEGLSFRIPDLSSNEGQLYVDGDDWNDYDGDFFGVKK